MLAKQGTQHPTRAVGGREYETAKLTLHSSWRECIAAELAATATTTSSTHGLAPADASPAPFAAPLPDDDLILVHVRGGDRRAHSFHSFCRLAPLVRYITRRTGMTRVEIAVETQFDRQRVMIAHVPAILELAPGDLKVPEACGDRIEWSRFACEPLL